MKEFKNKTAFVTGAASGIGLALSQALLAEGANVMLADIDEAGLSNASNDVGIYAEEFRLDETLTQGFDVINNTPGAESRDATTKGLKNIASVTSSNFHRLAENINVVDSITNNNRTNYFDENGVKTLSASIAPPRYGEYWDTLIISGDFGPSQNEKLDHIYLPVTSKEKGDLERNPEKIPAFVARKLEEGVRHANEATNY